MIKKVSKHRYGRYKYFYIESLKEIEDGRYVDGLIMMLNSKDYYKKIYAVKALRYTRDERVLKPLEEKFNDKSEHVRSEAILAYDAVKREVEFKAEAPVYRDTELTSVAVPSAGGSYSIKDIQIPDSDCVECPVCKAVQRNNRTRCYNCGARFE